MPQMHKDIRLVLEWEQFLMDAYATVNNQSVALGRDLARTEVRAGFAEDNLEDAVAVLRGVKSEFEGYGHKDGNTMRAAKQVDDFLLRYDRGIEAREERPNDATG